MALHRMGIEPLSELMIAVFINEYMDHLALII